MQALIIANLITSIALFIVIILLIRVNNRMKNEITNSIINTCNDIVKHNKDTLGLLIEFSRSTSEFLKSQKVKEASIIEHLNENES